MHLSVPAPLAFGALLTTALVPACARDDANPLSPGRLGPRSDKSVSQLLLDDPSGCALQGSPLTASVYRRPLPTTNLRFLSAVMFDGRESVQPLNNGSTFLANLRTDLAHQAMDATLGHAQASASPSAAQLGSIVDFELALFSAQHVDDSAGVLNAQN